MNDDRLIQLLEGLKKFEPKEKNVSVLKGRVFSSVEKEKPVWMPVLGPGFARFFFRPIFLYPAVILLFVVAIATQGDWLSNKLQAAYLETRIAIASNGYEKASLSLNLSESELGNVGWAGNGSVRQVTYLSAVTAETDRYMRDLHLVGEPGKYSGEQCLAAYKEYDDYLGRLKAVVSAELTTANDPSLRAALSSLLGQADQYQAAANAKLRLY